MLHRATRLIAAFAIALSAGTLFGAPFTPGNIVVQRVGDGSAALSQAATAIYLDEYTPTGTLVQTITMPTATGVGGNRMLTAAGSQGEGIISRSTNGAYLLVSGYDAAPGTAAIAGTATTVVPRVIGRVDWNGTVDTTTTTTSFSGANIRSAVSTDGSSFWVAGSNSGVIYTTFGGSGTGTSIASNYANLRSLTIGGNQLYVTAQTGTAPNQLRAGTAGTGLPTTADTITRFNLPVAVATYTLPNSPYGIFMADLDGTAGIDTMYIADDGAAAYGIQKWSLVSGAWTNSGYVSASVARGITGIVTGTSVQLFVAGTGTLYTLTDSSGFNGTLAGTPTAIATAGTNRGFRGVALAPVDPAGPAPAPTVSSINRATSTPTNLSSVNFTATFSQAVTGVDTTDFTLATSGLTGASITGISGSGTTYTVTVSTGTGDGTVGLNLVDDDTITNGTTPLGGSGAANGNFTGQVYTIDHTAPAVVAIARAGSNPTNATLVDFTVEFSEALTGVGTSTFTLATTGVTGTSITGVAPGTRPGIDYIVSVNTGSGDGTIRLDVPAGAINDPSGNAITAFSSGESFTIVKSVPSAPAAPTGLTATGGNATVDLSWNSAATASSYSLFRSTTSGTGYVSIATDVTATTYADNTVTNGTTYYYVVRAVNAFGSSPDSNEVSATPALPRNAIGVVISQVYGGSGGTYNTDYIELFNPTATAVLLDGYSLQYGSTTGNFASQATNLYAFPAGTTIGAGRYLSVRVGAVAGSGTTPLTDLSNVAGPNLSGTNGKVALATIATALPCGTTPCTLPHANIVDLVGYGPATTTAEGNAPTPDLSGTTGAFRRNNGCLDTNNNLADFLIVDLAGGLVPRTAANYKDCATEDLPPTITAPANPVTTVMENATPFPVYVSGSDDKSVYDWSATPGTGVQSVVVTADGTSTATYTVTLQTNFYGTASFTATLSDTVNGSVSRTVNIAVTRDPAIDHSPVINTPADPAAYAAKGAPTVNVNLTGFDDNALYVWSATPGTGITAVTPSLGQGTSNVTFSATLDPNFLGTASFTATLSDGSTTPDMQVVNIGVSLNGSTVNHVVISQVYGSGGNTGAAYANDYVELYNPTGSTVDLTGWSVQYGSSGGTTFSGIAPLAGPIGPNEYFLVALGTNNSSVGSDLPPANISVDTVNLSATAGKVALMRTTTALSGPCASMLANSDLVDLLGYGSGVNCSEGSAFTTAVGAANAMFRAGNGDIDTNQNNADFSVKPAAPRRTATIMEFGPSVKTVDPANANTIAPRDANIVINFNEGVDAVGSWYDVTCTISGSHNDATTHDRFTKTSWTIVPNVNFTPGESCTVTLFANFITDTDTDDSAPGTNYLGADYTWTFSVATGDAPVYTSDVHTALGAPIAVAAPATAYTHAFLMDKPEFTISYNKDRGIPNWVAWHLADEWTGALARLDTFRADPQVDPTWFRVLGSDYSGSGFDRGHLVPNADRDKDTARPANQATFLMTNMIPQAPGNNQGPWAAMEGDLRLLLPANELYIVAGGTGTGGTGTAGFATTIANGNVTVPEYTWKVALVLPKGTSDLSRVTASTRSIAVIMPNLDSIRPNAWTTYLTTIDAVEALTGYDFFSALPDAIEAAIESGTNGTNKPGAANVSVTVAEDNVANFLLDAVSPTNASLTYTAVTTPVNGSLAASTTANQTYTPGADFFGTDSFTYKANDGQDSNVATVSITVTEVNDAPVAGADTLSGTANTPLTITAGLLTGNDAAGPLNENSQTLAVSTVYATGATLGTVQVDGAGWTYTPQPGYIGSDVLAYSVCDNGTTNGAAASLCTVGSITINLAPQVPASIVAVSGTPQSTTINTTFAALLRVRVMDGAGRPVTQASVTFAAPASGPSGTFAAASTVVTDADGYASAPQFTANGIVGTYNVTATAGSVSATFTLTNVAQVPASMTVVAGTPQSALVTTAFAAPLQVRIVDGSNVPVAGLAVTFTAPAAGPGGTFSGSNIVTTDAAGIATAPSFIANTLAGSYTVTAAYNTLSAAFSLTNVADAPAQITAIGGTPQVATVNTAFATALRAKVTDIHGNPIAGVTVTFSSPATGASGTFASSPTVTTDALGIATAPVFTANNVSGSYAVTATAGSLSTTFALENTLCSGTTAMVANETTLLCAPGQVTISVSLAGTAPFSITWSDGVIEDNITTAQHTRTVSVSQSTAYQIVSVGDATCSNGVASGIANVLVSEPVTIIEAPKSQTVTTGSRVNLFVITSATTATYQWYEGASGDESKPVKDATSDTLQTLPLGRSTSFWVKITTPCASVNSAAAAITVNPPGNAFGRRRAAGRP